MYHFIQVTLFVVFTTLTGAAQAQGMQVAFGNATQDSALPVEITAENLDVSQKDGTATFSGNVLIGQGELRLSAPHVLVVYRADHSGIARLEATGGVTLVSGDDAAEAQRADYNVETGMVDLAGEVLLVQSTAAITGDRMTVNTVAGTARISGQVKTVLQPENQR